MIEVGLPALAFVNAPDRRNAGAPGSVNCSESDQCIRVEDVERSLVQPPGQSGNQGLVAGFRSCRVSLSRFDLDRDSGPFVFFSQGAIERAQYDGIDRSGGFEAAKQLKL
jgi:hypothetical protein